MSADSQFGRGSALSWRRGDRGRGWKAEHRVSSRGSRHDGREFTGGDREERGDWQHVIQDPLFPQQQVSISRPCLLATPQMFVSQHMDTDMTTQDLLMMKNENFQLKNSNYQLMEQNSRLKEQMKELQNYVNRVEEKIEQKKKPLVTEQLKQTIFQREMEKRELENLLQEEKSFRLIDAMNAGKLSKEMLVLQSTVGTLRKELEQLRNNDVEQVGGRKVKSEHQLNSGNLAKKRVVFNVKRTDLEKLVVSNVQKIEKELRKEIMELSTDNKKLQEKAQSLQEQVLSLKRNKKVKSADDEKPTEHKTGYKIAKKEKSLTTKWDLGSHAAQSSVQTDSLLCLSAVSVTRRGFLLRWDQTSGKLHNRRCGYTVEVRGRRGDWKTVLEVRSGELPMERTVRWGREGEDRDCQARVRTVLGNKSFYSNVVSMMM